MRRTESEIDIAEPSGDAKQRGMVDLPNLRAIQEVQRLLLAEVTDHLMDRTEPG